MSQETSGQRPQLEVDPVWNQYMERKRNWRELVALLANEDLKPIYPQRILEVLLAPDIGKLPFPVNTDSKLLNHLSVRVDWRTILKGEQRAQAAQLVDFYLSQVERRTDKESLEALWEYNRMIQVLLPVLKPEQAARLFSRFRINNINIEPYSSMDSRPVYNPLRNLYEDPAIDDSWKEQAASRMHDVIQKEQAGDVEPRVNYEAAVKCYSEVLGLILQLKKLPVSREFYQNEIAFMLGVDTGEPILDSWHTGKAMGLLEDLELKHKFVRRQVLTGKPGSFRSFTVYDQAGATTARRVLEEFPRDQEVRTYLERQLKEWQVRSKQERQSRKQATKQEQDVLRRMKTYSTLGVE